MNRIVNHTQKKDLEPLSFLIGKWQTVGEVRATKNTPPIKFKGTDVYEWTLQGAFILHRVDVMMARVQTEAIEMIGNFNEINNTFKMNAFDNAGNLTVMQAHMDEHGILRFTGETMRAELQVDNPNTMIARWEKLEDSKNWVPWMDLKLTK
jgi:hypothetical protein